MTPVISSFRRFWGSEERCPRFQRVECKFGICAVFVKTAPFGKGQKHGLPKTRFVRSEKKKQMVPFSRMWCLKTLTLESLLFWISYLFSWLRFPCSFLQVFVFFSRDLRVQEKEKSLFLGGFLAFFFGQGKERIRVMNLRTC